MGIDEVAAAVVLIDVSLVEELVVCVLAVVMTVVFGTVELATADVEPIVTVLLLVD